jgi:hypothetical protein
MKATELIRRFGAILAKLFNCVWAFAYYSNTWDGAITCITDITRIGNTMMSSLFDEAVSFVI